MKKAIILLIAILLVFGGVIYAASSIEDEANKYYQRFCLRWHPRGFMAYICNLWVLIDDNSQRITDLEDRVSALEQEETSVASVTVTANPTSIPADGVSTSIITAFVKDGDDNPVVGQIVEFTIGSYSASAVTNSSGEAIITYTASTSPGVKTVIAQVGSIQDITQIIETSTQVGELSISALATPVSALVVAGSSGVVVGKFTLEAKYEDIIINYIGITLANPDGGINANEYDQVVSVALYEDGIAEALGSIELAATNATITPSTTLTIPAGTTKNYTLKATFANLSDVSPAQSGAGFRFKITSLDATGVSSGPSGITISGLDAIFNTLSIFKSLPTVTMLSFSGADMITGNTVISLFKFKVSADSAGPISLYKFSFGISTTTVNLHNSTTNPHDTTGFYVYMSDSESSLGSIVSRGKANGVNQEEGITTHRYMNDISATRVGSSKNQLLLETWFDKNDATTATMTDHIIINAGDTKYFTLRGTIASGHDGTADNESISTELAGDAAFATTASANDKNASEVYETADHDFIWSDLNADLYATSSATTTRMFYNGYRVSGLDSTTSTPQTITD